MLLMVGSLGLVFLLFLKSADPKTWEWIAPEEVPVRAPVAEGDREEPPAGPDLPPRDVRVERKAVEAENTSGEFRVTKSDAPATPYTLGSSRIGRHAVAPSQKWASEEALARVVDNSPFRSHDFEAWSQIFDNLQEAPPGRLSAQDAAPVQYGQLFQQSELYRGKLVTLSGTVRRCVKIPPSKLDARAGNLWQLWLFSGGDTSPIVLYCLDIPEGFPVGPQISQVVTVQAVYFKKWVYAAQGGTMTAPLLVARSVNWDVPETVARGVSSRELAFGVTATLIGAAVMVGLIWWNNRNRDSQVEQLVRQRNRQEFEEHAEEIAVGTSIRDQLGELSARLQKPNPPGPADDPNRD